MNSASSIKRKRCALSRAYQTALRKYLQQGAAASLLPAGKLGRQAIALGLETLDLALIHEQALSGEMLLLDSAAARDRIIKPTSAFFSEAIVPLEKTHRTALETNVRLSQLNRELGRHTQDLAASNQHLKKEIARRRDVEQALRQSERRTSRLLEQSRHLQEQLRLLSRQILSTQEDERKRISRELHDVIAQMLTGINVRLTNLKTDAASDAKGLSKKIARTQRLVEKSVDIVHRFARELRPAALDDLGLIPALHSLLKGFMKKTGIRTRLTAFTEVEKLSSAKRAVLYRVVQEALANVARHAQAGRVDVSIRKLSNVVHMQIKDDGKSFNVKRVLHIRKNQRLGVLGMSERVEMVGGKFTIESAPGKGTTLHARIPFNNGAREHTRP